MKTLAFASVFCFIKNKRDGIPSLSPLQKTCCYFTIISLISANLLTDSALFSAAVLVL